MDREKDNIIPIEEHEYKIDEKRVFIVTPVYCTESGKTIYDALLNLMKKHDATH